MAAAREPRQSTWPLGAGPSTRLALGSQQIAGLTMTKNTDFTVAQKGNQTIDQQQLLQQQTLGG